MLEDVVSCYHVKGYFDMWRSKTFRLYFFCISPHHNTHWHTHPHTLDTPAVFTSSNFPLALRPTGNDRTWQLHPAVRFNQRSVSLFYIDSCSWPIEVNKTTLIQTCDSDLWERNSCVRTLKRLLFFNTLTSNWKLKCVSHWKKKTKYKKSSCQLKSGIKLYLEYIK